MPKVSKAVLEKMYIQEGKSMREISAELHISFDSVVYAMRKSGINRRTFSEINEIRFKNKKPSFSIKDGGCSELSIAGAMLYWAEGCKTGTVVDFANSDPHMVAIFISFLRDRYLLKEEKLRVYIYCYADQDIDSIRNFWSKLTGIPITQFTRPYVKEKYREDGRKMKYGMIHVRYSDKKLLLDILGLIESFKDQLCVGGRVVNCT